MNIDNDYDNDGNNIVPCPICLDVYCPSKENGKCPEEDMFALEGEIRMLLDEYKATDDNSRIANVLEAVEKILHHQLQKAREETIHRILAIVSSKQNQFTSTYERGYQDCVKNILESIHHYQSKLDKPN